MLYVDESHCPFTTSKVPKTLHHYCSYITSNLSLLFLTSKCPLPFQFCLQQQLCSLSPRICFFSLLFIPLFCFFLYHR